MHTLWFTMLEESARQSIPGPVIIMSVGRSPSIWFAEGEQDIVALPLKCRVWALLASLSICTDLLAEETPAQKPGIYDKAVGVQWNELVERSRSRLNPETMVEVQFQQVMERIETMTGMQVWLDSKSIADSRIDLSPQTRVVEWPAGETVAQLTNRLSAVTDTPLAWYVQDGVAALTTAEAAGQKYVTRQYPIGDLLAQRCDPVEIVSLLQTVTEGPWETDEPGTGTISLLGNFLFIRQTHRTHQEVTEILAGLRRTEPVVLLNCSENDLRLRRLLEEKRVTVELPDNTLVEFVQLIQELSGAKFRMDEMALTDAGLDREARLQGEAIDLPLRVVLSMLLGNVHDTELTVIVADDECLVTTAEAADLRYETVLYRLESWGVTGENVDQFAEMIHEQTTGPWDSHEPGTGTMALVGPLNVLAVRQSNRIHREILTILRDLRPEPGVRPATPPPSPPAAALMAVVAVSKPAMPAPSDRPVPVPEPPSLPVQVISPQPSSHNRDNLGGNTVLILALLVGCVAGYLGRGR